MQAKKVAATYIFISEHIIFGNYVLNFIDSIIGLGFRKGALLIEQGDVDRSCTTQLLMKNLQVVTKGGIFKNYFKEKRWIYEKTNDLNSISFSRAIILTYYFPPFRAINSDLCDANEKIL